MHTGKPIFWRQGVFLQPQHFQLTELYRDYLLKPFREHGQPYFWGVNHMNVREDALLTRRFEIVNGSFVFANGAHVAYPGNAVIQPRSFESDWVDAEKPFTVYLGLRKWNSAGHNVTVVDSLKDVGRVSTTYATEANPEDAPDMYGDGPSAKVQRMSYVLKIFWETELDELDDYELIPVAQLARDAESVVFAERFVPPCLNVYSMEQLSKLFRDVRDLVISRSQQLDEYKSPGELQSKDFDVSYMVFLLALRSLNRYVPVFQQLSETKTLHPWTAYLYIRQVVAELSSFTEGIGALGERHDGEKLIPNYDHENLWDCFYAAKQLVTQMVESITVGPEFLVRFQFQDPYFTAELPARVFDRRNRFWLLLRTETPLDQVVAEVRHVLKLSATMGMTSLLSRAVSGIPLEHHSDPPTGLPKRVNTVYFKIDNMSPLWDDVERNGSIAMYWDTAPEDLMAQLVVLKG
ncbi:MAG: type secretion system protein ImpJ [Desulfovibrionales bacterium]|nr:type secretion system protein ImpJ [Desulfovibrionales bacterium]